MVGELCPGCGAPLEPVSDLGDVVGYRRVTRRADPPTLDIAQAAALPRPDAPPALRPTDAS